MVAKSKEYMKNMMKHDGKIGLIGIPKKIIAEALVDVDGYDVHSNILLSSSPVYENVITTYAGSGNFGYRGDGGPATSSWLGYPTAVAVDVSNNLYIVDGNNNVIRMVTNAGIITTVAGNGYVNQTSQGGGYSGDGGLATSAALNYPAGVAVGTSGTLWIADSNNNVIRMVTSSDKIITTFAGKYFGGYSGDHGPATNAQLSYPQGVAVDIHSNVYIADSANHVIRLVVYATGIITTLVGNGNSDYSGDGGPATGSSLNFPRGVSVGTSGALWIADSRNNVIRMVSSSSKIITTYAGSAVGYPNGGYSGDDGPATNAQLDYPAGLYVDSLDNVWIADSNNGAIRLVTNSTKIITTFAGSPSYYSVDIGDFGPATSAHLIVPSGVCVGTSGAVFIADLENDRIRVVSKMLPCSPGYYDSSGICAPCSAGTYRGNSSILHCNSCPINRYSSVVGASVCTACPTKLVTGSLLGATSIASCVCPINTYVSGSVCTACPSGLVTGSVVGASSITSCVCPFNTYSSIVGSATMCIACPSGMITDYVGATSIANCVCPINTYSSVVGSATVCTACPSGLTNYVQGATECSQVA